MPRHRTRERLAVPIALLIVAAVTAAASADPARGPATTDCAITDPSGVVIEAASPVHDPAIIPAGPGSLIPDPSTLEPGTRAWLKAVEGGRAMALRRLKEDEAGGARTEGGAGGPVARARLDNCPHDFDVLHYDVDLAIDFTAQTIRGSTQVEAVSEIDGLEQITLDLASLTVDSVRTTTGSLAFSHAAGVLSITLDRAYDAGEPFLVEVFYGGQPANEGPSGFGGFYFSTANGGIAYQMGVGLNADPPSMAKCWIPCWDHPCDKATIEYRITVPDDKKAVCNGVLVREEADPASRAITYTWSETHQIAPHVMMVAASNYTELVDTTYDWIHYWVYPSQVGNAATHFAYVHIMMDAFVSRYGSYPFGKFGYAAAPKGDMEHQTCVTHLSSLIQANHVYDWLLAHEMGHQWWGDCVAINDWRDVWLSEGFATYSEAIHREYQYGLANYLAYMQTSLMQPVLNSSENFPIYDPDYLWGTTVYEKGGCVLHMLRHVMGDDAFFEALALYRSRHEHGNAVTAQFQDAAETVHGSSLDWFFQPWIYDVGWPKYRYAWIAQPGGGTGHRLVLSIDQVQTNGPVFTMPVDVKVTTASGDTTMVLWIDEAHEYFDLPMPGAPLTVTLDPDNWILNQVEQVAPAGIEPELGDDPGDPGHPGTSGGGLHEAGVLSVRPNPFRGATTIRLEGRRVGVVRLEIVDPSGRRVRSFESAAREGAAVEVDWDGRDAAGRPVPAGTYFVRVAGPMSGTSGRVIVVR